MTEVTSTLKYAVEHAAQEATHLPAFKGFSVEKTRAVVADALALIGRDGIFDQYTKHDISHIDAMLESLGWIVPSAAAEHLTSADWLLIVLAVYLHDLGMLVTADEYLRRDESGFRGFVEQLEQDESAADFLARVRRVGTLEAQDRFLYEEFVRHHHAARIRAWIMNQPGVEYGAAAETVALLDALLVELPRNSGATSRRYVRVIILMISGILSDTAPHSRTAILLKRLQICNLQPSSFGSRTCCTSPRIGRPQRSGA